MLEVRDLLVSFAHPLGLVRAVGGVSFGLAPGEPLGLAGESGCSKSTMALAILRMVRLPGRITGGSVRLDGVELSALDDEAMRRLRLAAIALVPQGSAGGFAAFQDLAYGLTGPAAGLLADRFGYAVVFLVGGLAASVGFALVVALGWQRWIRAG